MTDIVSFGLAVSIQIFVQGQGERLLFYKLWCLKNDDHWEYCTVFTEEKRHSPLQFIGKYDKM